MNNCAIRTGLSGVMGLGLGAMFGVAMGTFDTAVRPHLTFGHFANTSSKKLAMRTSCTEQLFGWQQRPSG